MKRKSQRDRDEQTWQDEVLRLCCLGKHLVPSIENDVIQLRRFLREDENCLTCSPSKRLHPIGLWAFPLNCRESQT